MTQKKKRPFEIAKERAWLKMPPLTRQAALELDEKLRINNRHQILMRFDLGRKVEKILAHADIYGPNAIAQLAEIPGIKGGIKELYQMRDVAVTLTRESVSEVSSTPTAGGMLLSFGHFVELVRLPSLALMREVLRRIREDDLTVAQTHSLVDDLTQ